MRMLITLVRQQKNNQFQLDKRNSNAHTKTIFKIICNHGEQGSKLCKEETEIFNRNHYRLSFPKISAQS